MTRHLWEYLKKLSVYTLEEKYLLLKYSIGSFLVNRTPLGLKNTYRFTNDLLADGVKFRRVGNRIQFEYFLNSSKEAFEIKASSSDSLVFEQIIVREEYKAIRSILSKYSIVPRNMIDAGANIGLTSRYFRAFYPEIEIIALEPSDETFLRLQHTIALGNFNKIHLLRKGLWNTETFLKADYFFKDGQDWSFRLVETEDSDVALFSTTSIPAIIDQFHLEFIDFLKIDIEGGEVNVFMNLSELHWLQKVKVIAIEIHDELRCRETIEGVLSESFTLSHSGELTIGIHKSIV